jgi:hypothetical protein
VEAGAAECLEPSAGNNDVGSWQGGHARHSLVLNVPVCGYCIILMELNILQIFIFHVFSLHTDLSSWATTVHVSLSPSY